MSTGHLVLQSQNTFIHLAISLVAVAVEVVTIPLLPVKAGIDIVRYHDSRGLTAAT